MTPEQLIKAMQDSLQKDESNWVKKVELIGNIQDLIDENKHLREEVTHYENVLVDLGYLRYVA